MGAGHQASFWPSRERKKNLPLFIKPLSNLSWISELNLSQSCKLEESQHQKPLIILLNLGSGSALIIDSPVGANLAASFKIMDKCYSQEVKQTCLLLQGVSCTLWVVCMATVQSRKNRNYFFSFSSPAVVFKAILQEYILAPRSSWSIETGRILLADFSLIWIKFQDLYNAPHS